MSNVNSDVMCNAGTRSAGAGLLSRLWQIEKVGKSRQHDGA